MEDPLKKIVFSKDVIEFVTVSLEYCAFLETFSGFSSQQLTDRLSKLLPLIYLKATMLPDVEMLEDFSSEVVVDEELYNYISGRIFSIYGKDDTYLEVFLEDMKYSETPISASISEDLTDIYQDLKNFISIYEQGIPENMNDALSVCKDNFQLYWGQKLVNVLRALHCLKYAIDEADVNNGETENLQEEW